VLLSVLVYLVRVAWEECLSSAWPLRFQSVNDDDHDERRLSPRCRVSERNGKGDEDKESTKRKLAQHSVVRCCIRCRRNLAKERGAHKKQQLEDERYGDGAWQQGIWLKLPSASAFRHAARTRRSVISESAWVILGP